jgi:hypothetical protein
VLLQIQQQLVSRVWHASYILSGLTASNSCNMAEQDVSVLLSEELLRCSCSCLVPVQ